jgi:hypothetical protein
MLPEWLQFAANAFAVNRRCRGNQAKISSNGFDGAAVGLTPKVS